MTEQPTGIFAAASPFDLVRDWLQAAQAAEPNAPNAAALATVDATGMPNVRMVLVKGFEDTSFVFYTNYESDKAAELDHAGRAALCFHWKSLRRQIRIRGHVEREDGPVADAYYRSRGVGSRLGAWASAQSRPLQDRDTLKARLEEVRARFGDDPPRPPFWGGYRLSPESLEFWADGADRLHDRFRWTRAGAGWEATRLSP